MSDVAHSLSLAFKSRDDRYGHIKNIAFTVTRLTKASFLNNAELQASIMLV